MSGINVNRWLAGGVAAGVLIWVLEGIGSVLYRGQMETALEAHNLSMEMSAAVIFISVVVSLVAGLTLVFFYAAARPRFGPGPKTAVIVAVAFWFGSMFLSLMGYHMMNLFPPGLLVMWGVMGLVEWILAALLGGVIYKEA